MTELLSRTLLIALGAITLIIAGMLIYTSYLIDRIRKIVRDLPRRPQVARDHTGRRIKERV